MRIQTNTQIGVQDIEKTIKEITAGEIPKHATIRAVYIKSHDSKWEYLIGECFLGRTEDDIEEIYADYAFVRKSFPDFNLHSLLNSLETKGQEISKNLPLIKKTKTGHMSWDHEIVPSHATASTFPVREFSTKINDNVNFSDSIILGFDLPFHASSQEFVKSFMELDRFHGHSDVSRGSFMIKATDSRGKISFDNNQISIDPKSSELCLVGQISDKEKIILKKDECKHISQKDIFDSELWLLTQENEIIDFRSKSEFRFSMEASQVDPAKVYLDIIEKGEGQVCEFKAYIDVTVGKNSKADEINKSVCALSNAQGGYIFIGVADDGSIPGIDDGVKKHYRASIDKTIPLYIKDIKKQLCETLIDNQCFEISTTQLGSKYIVVIVVTRSSHLNYYTNEKLAYIRKGSTCFKMSGADERTPDKEPNLFSLGDF